MRKDLTVSREVFARIFRDIETKGQKCEEGEKELTLLPPSPNVHLKLLLNQAFTLQNAEICLWLHFKVANAFKWR